jgi:DNA mismatch endonuclease (patch repair protein)
MSTRHIRTISVRPDAVRSYTMSRIRGKNTTPERRLRALLQELGLRGYRLHVRLQGAGNPDIVWRRRRVCLFIDGCFWHRCPICRIAVPVRNRSYWQEKFRRNRLRDRRTDRVLIAAGWHVLRLWEHEVLTKPDACLRRIRRLLTKQAHSSA